jgi:type I restriction enzyme M protein
VFTDEDFYAWPDTYHQWRNIGGNYADIEGFCKSATIEEVQANGGVLSPGRYVGSEVETEDGVPFEDKMQALTRQLHEQF